MPIALRNDISYALKLASYAGQEVSEPYRSAVADAMSYPSVVDRICYCIEPLYAVVQQDAAMGASAASSVVEAVAQLAHLITLNQWHGKGQRAADMVAAMNALADGLQPSALVGAPAVDPQFGQGLTP